MKNTYNIVSSQFLSFFTVQNVRKLWILYVLLFKTFLPSTLRLKVSHLFIFLQNSFVNEKSEIKYKIEQCYPFNEIERISPVSHIMQLTIAIPHMRFTARKKKIEKSGPRVSWLPLRSISLVLLSTITYGISPVLSDPL
jgi:hypothetical protein